MKKVIVISGGSDGLGKEIAKILSPYHIVVILSPNKENLENTSKEINCEYEMCDVSNFENCKNSIENIINKFGKIDVLINNAGIWIEGILEDNSPERISEVMNINTTGTIFLTKATVPYMKEKSNGLIINIISQAGIYTKAERSVYTSSKWALTGFTKSIQTELAKYNIGVTGIYPGKMNTKLFEKYGTPKDMVDGLEPINVAKTIEFILGFDSNILFPEIGIKNIKN